MAHVREDDGLVRQTVEQFRGGTVRPHIRCGNEARALNDVQLRVLFGKFFDHGKMLPEGAERAQMHREERFGAARSEVTVTLSQSRQNDAAIIAQYLCAAAGIRLCARFVADVDEPAVRDGRRRCPGLFPVHGVDVAINDLIRCHCQTTPFLLRVSLSMRMRPSFYHICPFGNSEVQ